MTHNLQGDTSVLTHLFAHNAWANLKLLDFCQNLTDEQLDSTATGGYGSIRDTVRHIIGSEVSYVERVNGKSPAQPIPKREFAGFEVLKAGARWTGDELLELALSAHTDTLVRQRSPGRNSEYPLAA